MKLKRNYFFWQQVIKMFKYIKKTSKDLQSKGLHIRKVTVTAQRYKQVLEELMLCPGDAFFKERPCIFQQKQ